MRHLLIEKTQNPILQFIRYLFVGGFAAVADTGTLFFFHRIFGVNYLIAAAIGFLGGLLTNYWISVAWVFETSGRIKEEFILFAIIGIGGLLWTELIIWSAVHLASLPLLTAKMISLFLVLVWNFWMRKKFVFSTKPIEQISAT